MKKVQVNAQVTAVISLFEFLGNISHFFLLAYMKGTTFVSLYHAILLYHVVLPYSFLMNTSENKNRVIEKGWTNILKNLLGKPHTNDENEENLEENDSPLQKVNDKELTDSRETNKKDELITRPCGSETKFLHSEENSLPNVPSSEHPTCSNLSSSHGNEEPKTSNFQTLDVKTLVQNVNNHPLAKKQITEAIKNLKNEEKYLQNFKKLVALQEFCQGGKAVSELCLENEFKTTNITLDEELPKRKQGHWMDEIKFKKDLLINETTFEGKIKEKCQIRATILYQLDSSYDDAEKFESLMDELISYEENFIQNM